MSESTTAAEPVTAPALLDAARGHRQVADRAEADLLATALAWAAMHPAESIDQAATLIGYGENAVAIAGPGAPLVAEFCLAELAAALGMRTEHGWDLVGETLELAHRLPKIWHSVQNGTLQAWRARRIARATMHLSKEAAAYVDRHLFRYAHRVGLPTVDRLIAEAVALFMPSLAEQQRREAADRRCVDIDPRTVSFDGTCLISGELDLADALDLDTALDAGADVLAAAGSTETKRVNRSVALGDLARGIYPLPLPATCDDASRPQPPVVEQGPSASEGTSAETPHPLTPSIVAPRRVVLHVHLSDAVLGGSAGIARLEGTAGQGGRHLVTTDQVRDWCRTAGTVTITPVVDTTARLSVEAYEIPDRMHAQAAARDIGCVFPWCQQSADRCDTDHVIPYSRGGPTATDNLAPLCRHHHRLKTHAGWTETMIEPGVYLWRSPLGAAYIRDHTGTSTT